MQTVYDTLRNFAMVLGDHDTDIDEQYRGLHRGVKVIGTNDKNQKVFSDIPYILRAMVTVDPDTTQAKHGSFSMAFPAVVVEEGNTLFLRVLNKGGEPEKKLGKIADWELPEGGQDGIADGDSGVLVVGTEIDEEKKIFVPGRSALVADHRGLNATLGSSIVRDLGPSQLKALLAKSMWIAQTPTRVDAERRNAITWNALSMGARSGKAVEHQGGAVTLYNTNIQSFSGEIPRVISWAAELDDGPFFAGEGHKDAHIKGVDAEGMPHLPLMFKTDRTKFGPGPGKYPAAPFDFLDYFAAPPVYSERIYRAEIVYDKAQFHPNPSGIIDPVVGRWVVQYRLPHKPPTDDAGVKKPIDRAAKDKGVKTPIDSTSKPDTGKKDKTTKKPRNPETGDPNPKPKPGSPITGDPPDKKPENGDPQPGPGATGDGPGHCGHPGVPSKGPGPGTPSTGPGSENEPPSDNTPTPSGVATGPITQEDQERKQAALKKKREAEKARATGDFGPSGFIAEQANVNPAESLSSVLESTATLASAMVDRAPMLSHLQVAYPVIKGLVPNPEFESHTRATMRGDLSAEDLGQVDEWALSATQIAAFGNTVLGREALTDNQFIDTVVGGFVIAGADLKPEEIYDGTSNLTAQLVFRREAQLVFDNPDKDGTVPTGHIIEQDYDNGEMVYRAQDLSSGDSFLLSKRFHFKTPVRITQVDTLTRLAMDHYDGLMVLDTDLNTPFMSVGGAWLDLGQQDTDTGEVNTMSNRGAGQGVYYQKTGVDFELKSINVSAPLTISSDTNEITVGLDDSEYIQRDGSVAMTGALDMGAQQITNVGNVDGVDVSAHASRHERAGADEIDGDHVDIDFTPSNYTPSIVPAEAAHVDDLAAHLAGIDDALGSATGIPTTPYTAISSINIAPCWFKKVIDYTDVQTAASSITINTFLLPIKGWIYNIHWKVTTPWAASWAAGEGGGGPGLGIEIGDAEDDNRWLTITDLIRDDGKGGFDSFEFEDALHGITWEPDFDNTHQLTVDFTADTLGGGEDLNDLTAGEFTIWYQLSSMNAGVAG